METALMAAMMSGNFLLGEKLIAEKADLNQADIGSKTVLIYAAFFKK